MIAKIHIDEISDAKTTGGGRESSDVVNVRTTDGRKKTGDR